MSQGRPLSALLFKVLQPADTKHDEDQIEVYDSSAAQVPLAVCRHSWSVYDRIHVQVIFCCAEFECMKINSFAKRENNNLLLHQKHKHNSDGDVPHHFTRPDRTARRLFLYQDCNNLEPSSTLSQWRRRRRCTKEEGALFRPRCISWPTQLADHCAVCVPSAYARTRMITYAR